METAAIQASSAGGTPLPPPEPSESGVEGRLLRYGVNASNARNRSHPTLQPRPEIARINAVVHGAIGDAEIATYGLLPSDVADFSVNCNPLGPSPRVREALASVDPARYPDDSAGALRAALAGHFGVHETQIAAGNGSAELLWLIGLAYLRPGDRLTLFGPTFGEYERAGRVMGAEVHTLDTMLAGHAALDLDGASDWLAKLRPRVAVICNPNNPTGTYLETGHLRRLVDASQRTLFVIDEAYAAFTRDAAGPRIDALCANLSLVESGRVLLLRSMTKDYALAGLRLGYALASAPIIDALNRTRPPWNVNAAAQAAGLAALGDTAHLAAAQQAAAAAVDHMRRRLTAGGLRALPTCANFFLVEVGDAKAVRQALVRQGLVVRDCTSFGLPHMARIAARPLADCERLVTAMLELGPPR